MHYTFVIAKQGHESIIPLLSARHASYAASLDPQPDGSTLSCIETDHLAGRKHVIEHPSFIVLPSKGAIGAKAASALSWLSGITKDSTLADVCAVAYELQPNPFFDPALLV